MGINRHVTIETDSEALLLALENLYLGNAIFELEKTSDEKGQWQGEIDQCNWVDLEDHAAQVATRFPEAYALITIDDTNCCGGDWTAYARITIHAGSARYAGQDEPRAYFKSDSSM